VAQFNFDAALRWARYGSRKALVRRSDKELPFLNDDVIAGPAVLLDTCVYIDQLQARCPGIVELLVETRHVGHSAVAIQELMHTVGVLDPWHPKTKSVTAEIRRLIVAMPAHRVFVPDLETLGRAALLSGVLSRLQGYTRGARLRALQDCVLFLQAQRLGLTLLTANVSDYDYLLQLVPEGRVLLYRRTAK
jgi:hypothetical protein